MNSPSTVTPPSAIARQTVRRINRRFMPFIFVLFVVAYMDRANMGFAGLQMTRELGFSSAVFGFGSGIFFVGYFLLEIPGTILAEVWSARKWISRIMISWGLLASATGLIHNAQQFYWIRFFLGVAEAGFFPGIIVFISHWYRPEDRGKAVALFMAAIPTAQLVSAPLSALLLRFHWLGWSGWRWLLILEGAPALVLGAVTIFYLTDRPQQASWLKPAERDWLAGELAKEQAAFGPRIPILKALRNPDVLLLAAISFFGLTPNYGLSLWLPQMVQRLSTFGVSNVSLISAIPYLCSLPLMLLTGWHSDRTGERRWHTAIPRIVSGVALGLCCFTLNNIWLSVLMLSIAAVGFYCAHPGFWPMPNMILSGPAAAAGLGLINSFGNLGGFIGPNAIGLMSGRGNDFRGALLFLAGCAFLSGLLVLRVRITRGPVTRSASRSCRWDADLLR